MVKSNYVISGIPLQVGQKLGSEFRKDVKIFIDENGNILARISLTKIGAFVLRIKMMMYNFKHKSVYKLNKCKGKHFGV